MATLGPILIVRGFDKELVGGGWRPTARKIQQNSPPEMCSPTHRGGIGKRVQKKGPNLWYGKDFLAPFRNL